MHNFLSRQIISLFSIIICLFCLFNLECSGAQATSDQATKAIAVTQSQETLPGQHFLTFFSHARGKEISYEAFIPLNAQPEERFPALYLLHGAFNNGSDWAKNTDNMLSELAASLRIVLIIPSCEDTGWYVDSQFVPTNKIESFIIKELLPHATQQLPISEKRSLTGLSMGGHGAITLALRHPELFVSASSMSGVMDITSHPQKWGIKKLLGSLATNRKLWEGYSALYLIKKLPKTVNPLDFPKLLITVGRDDTLVIAENRVFYEALQQCSLSYQYRETAGNHNWTYWRNELPQHAAFHAKILHN